jgi:hypothetical protein
MKARKMVLLAVILTGTISAQTTASGKASTTGPCSPATSGSHNQFFIKCVIAGPERKQVVALLNTVLASKIDIELLMKKVNEMSKDNGTLLSYGSPTHGELLPGNEPDPPLPDGCTHPPGGYTIFMGDSVAWTHALPLVAFQAGQRDFVSLEPLDKGIAVTATTTAPDGKIIAQIKQNQFVVNSNNTLDRSVSKDNTTLQVIDEYGQKALSIAFLNPHSIRILGRFSSSRGQVIIGDHSTVSTGGGSTFSGTCAINNGVGLQFQ